MSIGKYTLRMTHYAFEDVAERPGEPAAQRGSRYLARSSKDSAVVMDWILVQ